MTENVFLSEVRCGNETESKDLHLSFNELKIHYTLFPLTFKFEVPFKAQFGSHSLAGEGLVGIFN